LEINPLNSASLDPPREAVSRPGSASGVESSTSATPPPAQVTLSGTSQKLIALQDGSHDIDAQRVISLTAAIAAGERPIDAQAVAEGVLATTLELLNVGPSPSTRPLNAFEASLLDGLNQENAAFKKLKTTIQTERHLLKDSSSDLQKLWAANAATRNALAQLYKLVAQRPTWLDPSALPTGCKGVEEVVSRTPQLAEAWGQRQALLQALTELSKHNAALFTDRYAAQERPPPQCDGWQAAE